MLKNGIRTCDVCGAEIPKGQTYVVNLIPKGKVPPEYPAEGRGVGVYSHGNLRLDVCLECDLHVSAGNETVN